MYLAITSRPYIIHSVSKLVQRSSSPHEEHMQAVKHILRYLGGAIDKKIVYENGKTSISGFSGANWGWKCFRPKILYRLYILRRRMSRIVGVQLLIEVGYSSGEAVVSNIDNQEAQKLTTNPAYHKRTKHIDIRFHHVREVVGRKKIVLDYCSTQEMVEGILSKNLSKTKHLYFVKLMKFIYLSLLTVKRHSHWEC